jgi:hypothetical protein
MVELYYYDTLKKRAGHKIMTGPMNNNHIMAKNKISRRYRSGKHYLL